MEFLVTISPRIPEELGEQDRNDLFARERESGTGHLRSGVYVRMWRPVGSSDALILLQADDRAAAEKLIGDLPLAPYCSTTFVDLIPHPLEAAEGNISQKGKQ